MDRVRSVASLLVFLFGCASPPPSVPPPAIAPLRNAALIRTIVREHLTVELARPSYVAVFGFLPWTRPAVLYPRFPERLVELGPGVRELDLSDPYTRPAGGHNLSDYGVLLVIATATPFPPSTLMVKYRQVQWEGSADRIMNKLLRAIQDNYAILEWSAKPELVP